MKLSPTLKAILISMLLGILIAAVMSEISYQVLKRENREPQQVELVIPAGTAERVARGEVPPSIPEDMSFVVGDTLIVVNQDHVDHQLGPLWIPPGTSASLALDTEQKFAFECSFQPTKYLGLEVREPVTLGTRLTGILFAGFPLGALFAVYSVLVIKPKDENS
ncbi:MAG: hypothetical protein Kow002_12990 [Anaerolineales bacterium]